MATRKWKKIHLFYQFKTKIYCLMYKIRATASQNTWTGINDTRNYYNVIICKVNLRYRYDWIQYAIFFNWPVARSIYIRTCTICLDMPSSFADICVFPLVKAGILRTAPQVANYSSIKNPLSAPDGVMPSKYLMVFLDL